MLDYREQIQSIYDFLKRSEVEQKYPYAYEINLFTGTEENALTSRTSGSKKFMRDIENAVEKAKQVHGIVRVDVFGGKSPNARKLNSYNVNINGIFTPQKPSLEKSEIKCMIDEAISQQPFQGGLGDLDNLLGMFNGSKDKSEGVKGLFGLFNTIAGNNKEVDRLNFQKQLDDFKFESRYNALSEKNEQLSKENSELRIEKEKYFNENSKLKSSNADLEQRLASYAPSELAKRVAIGAVTTLGSRILTNSPKTAELLGLSADELKGALGVIENSHKEIPETNVEITEIGSNQTPEEKKKADIIESISGALVTWGLQDVAKIANIVGLCLDRAEFINKTLTFLNGELERLSPNEVIKTDEVEV